MAKSVLSLAVILVYVCIVQGADTPCDGNEWFSEECIQYLQHNIRQLQDLVATQSDLLTTQSAQLANATQHVQQLQGQVATQSDQLTSQSAQLANASHHINNHAAQLQDLRVNTVPVGFIYAQLPGQLPPSQIWNTVSWSDVSAEYAGLFFRVLGGNSAQFTVTQAENSPRITHVQTVWQTNTMTGDSIPMGRYSDGVSSGVQAQSAGSHWALSFFVPNGEVRPRNTAMRIWRRI